MTDREKLDLIAEAVRDRQNGILEDLSFFVVVAGIVLPPEMTDADIAWGKRALRKLNNKK